MPDTSHDRSHGSFVVTAQWRAAPTTLARVLEFARAVASASRREPGCQQYDVHQSTEDPCELLIVERYASRADFAEHLASMHYREHVRDGVVPLLEGRAVATYELVGDGDGSPSVDHAHPLQHVLRSAKRDQRNA